MLGDISNTISLDLLYRGLVMFLSWSLPGLASDELITTSVRVQDGRL